MERMDAKVLVCTLLISSSSATFLSTSTPMNHKYVHHYQHIFFYNTPGSDECHCTCATKKCRVFDNLVQPFITAAFALPFLVPNSFHKKIYFTQKCVTHNHHILYMWCLVEPNIINPQRPLFNCQYFALTQFLLFLQGPRSPSVPTRGFDFITVPSASQVRPKNDNFRFIIPILINPRFFSARKINPI